MEEKRKLLKDILFKKWFFSLNCEQNYFPSKPSLILKQKKVESVKSKLMFVYHYSDML